MCARASVRREMGRSAVSGNGLGRWARLRAQAERSGGERVAGLVGGLMVRLVVLCRGVMLARRSCSRGGWREGRFIDYLYKGYGKQLNRNMPPLFWSEARPSRYFVIDTIIVCVLKVRASFPIMTDGRTDLEAGLGQGSS